MIAPEPATNTRNNHHLKITKLIKNSQASPQNMKINKAHSATIPQKQPLTKIKSEPYRNQAALSKHCQCSTYRRVVARNRYRVLSQNLFEKGDFGLQPGDFFLVVRGGQRRVESIDLGLEAALVRHERHHLQVVGPVLVEFAHFPQARTSVRWNQDDCLV